MVVLTSLCPKSSWTITNVVAVFQEMGRKAMTQRLTGAVLGNTSALDCLFDYLVVLQICTSRFHTGSPNS